jgi:hypothetical protein
LRACARGAAPRQQAQRLSAAGAWPLTTCVRGQRRERARGGGSGGLVVGSGAPARTPFGLLFFGLFAPSPRPSPRRALAAPLHARPPARSAACPPSRAAREAPREGGRGAGAKQATAYIVRSGRSGIVGQCVRDGRAARPGGARARAAGARARAS